MKLMEKIKKHGLLFDGAMGSILISKGMTGTEAAETWNIQHPDIIRQIHTDYLSAGADVVSANTYGASLLKLEKTGMSQDFERLNREGVRLAKTAGHSDHYVAADFGAMGDMLAPAGPVSFETAKDCFVRQAEILEDEGVDLFLVETVFDLNAGLCAVQAIQSVSGKPVFCSLTFKETPKGFYTIFGNAPEHSMTVLADHGVSAVGANCSLGSDAMVRLADQIRQSVDIPVIIQPNAGMPEITADNDTIYPENDDLFAANMKKIRDLGVEIIGGCCGTTPETIRKIRALL
ncbi:MAG: homocysteine S-methyltransferase family protein [Desulfotignum sp.]|nr:homocysteine S-methyltransferase family protein [Desulfotignum sp.]MCF8087846.1 homocysteine S-methyltransferase family protein [Desulfotignum sp.]MCF8137603.1 homocysteine S-methyltransferase family protein [Desulfotignum sp.]